MEKSDVKVAIRKAIDRAARAQRWTLGTLAGRLGIGVSTLHRWKANESTTIDVTALVNIFEYSGESMDRAFGLDVVDEYAPAARREGSSVSSLRDQGVLRTLLGLTKALSGITHQMEGTIEHTLLAGESEPRVAARREALSALGSLRGARSREDSDLHEAGIEEA